MKNLSKKSASILFIGMGWFPTISGGLNRYVYELVHQLDQAGDQVELCGVGLPMSESNSSIKLTNFASSDNPLWQRLFTVWINFAKRNIVKPDAINLHFALYSLPLLTSLPDDVPITFTFHGPWALESEWEGTHRLSVWLKHWLEKRVYHNCDRFIVLSQAFGAILHQQYQIPWSKIHVIPGGVDTKQFQLNLSRQQAREQLNWPQKRIIIFTPRRLVRRMGLAQLLTALKKIQSKIPDVWLVIAGKGRLRDKLEQQATELGLKDHVKFLGFLPDIELPIAYQAADLTVIPSQSLEGFGLVVLESLACGTPVLCTPVGGMPEILGNFSPELITDCVTAEAIALRLESLLNQEISMPSRNACREYAVTHFDWSQISQQVRQVLLSG